MNCRHCNSVLEHVFLDLGFAPPSNAYLSADDLCKPEVYFPLKLYVCEHCWLVQTADYLKAEYIFNDNYAYFSSVSQTWLDHALHYSQMIINRLSLGRQSYVIEIASNDGYLLKNFVDAGIPCLGIEPTSSTAMAARERGITVLEEFFSNQLAQKLVAENSQADLIIGNNVYAHVPDINDFTLGLKTLLKPGGTITLEFPHLMRLIEYSQFDTIYHEHYSYLSLQTVRRIFDKAGLRVWDVDELSTHGGSLRIYGCHNEDVRSSSAYVEEIIKKEEAKQLQTLATYLEFQSQANRIKNELLTFLIEQKCKGKKIAAYGAAAKGNTLINYAGVKPDLLPFVCDAAISKQGKLMPGSHIPIMSTSVLEVQRPDYLIILAWNIATEVKQQNTWLAELGTKFVTVVPELQIS